MTAQPDDTKQKAQAPDDLILQEFANRNFRIIRNLDKYDLSPTIQVQLVYLDKDFFTLKTFKLSDDYAKKLLEEEIVNIEQNQIFHPCIARCYEYSIEKGYILYYYEFGCSLNQLITTNQLKYIQGFDNTQIFIIVYGIAHALRAMHSKFAHNCGLVSYSLSTTNILLNYKLEPVITDFTKCNLNKTELKDYDQEEYDLDNKYIINHEKAVVYSFGKIVLSLLLFSIPMDKSQNHNLRNLDSPLIRNHVFYNLIFNTTCQDKNNRWTFDNVLAELISLGHANERFMEYTNWLRKFDENLEYNIKSIYSNRRPYDEILFAAENKQIIEAQYLAETTGIRPHGYYFY